MPVSKKRKKKQQSPSSKSKKEPKIKHSHKRLIKKIKNSELDYKIDPDLKFKRKVSELVLEYGAGFIQHCTTDDELRKAIPLLILCWNIGCLESEERLIRSKKIIQELNLFEIEDIIQNLIDRKATFYSEYRYHIVEYDLFLDNEDLRLNVASLELD